MHTHTNNACRKQETFVWYVHLRLSQTSSTTSLTWTGWQTNLQKQTQIKHYRRCHCESFTCTQKARQTDRQSNNLWQFNQNILISITYSASQKIFLPPVTFSEIFPKQLRIFNQTFTRLLHVHIYAKLPNFIHLLPSLTMLCRIKCAAIKWILTFHKAFTSLPWWNVTNGQCHLVKAAPNDPHTAKQS